MVVPNWLEERRISVGFSSNFERISDGWGMVSWSWTSLLFIEDRSIRSRGCCVVSVWLCLVRMKIILVGSAMIVAIRRTHKTIAPMVKRNFVFEFAATLESNDGSFIDFVFIGETVLWYCYGTRSVILMSRHRRVCCRDIQQFIRQNEGFAMDREPYLWHQVDDNIDRLNFPGHLPDYF